MPEIDGIELIKKIKQSLIDHSKLIMVSMYTQRNIIKAALKNGANCDTELKTVLLKQIEEAIKCSYSNIDYVSTSKHY